MGCRMSYNSIEICEMIGEIATVVSVVIVAIIYYLGVRNKKRNYFTKRLFEVTDQLNDFIDKLSTISKLLTSGNINDEKQRLSLAQEDLFNTLIKLQNTFFYRLVTADLISKFKIEITCEGVSLPLNFERVNYFCRLFKSNRIKNKLIASQLKIIEKLLTACIDARGLKFDEDTSIKKIEEINILAFENFQKIKIHFFNIIAILKAKNLEAIA